MLFSTIIINVTPVIDHFTAASLGVGNVSKLGYSTRLLALFLGLGAISISRSILPVMSRQSERSVKLELTIRWFFILFSIGCAMTLLTWALAPEMIKLVYQRGAFTANDTASVTSVFRMGIIQIPFYLSGIVLVQFFTSSQRYWILFSSSCVALFVKLTSVFILASYKGIEGIAFSTSLMYIGTFSFLIWAFLRDRRQSAKI